jgi:hydroxymethylpyrimidine pyrophosphatase-like HAD family hydrolase
VGLDARNDVLMFKRSGLSIAMGDASEAGSAKPHA